MDVDLLRPGSVPMSPDTILWFEFLLDQSLLKSHLQKANPDPGPIELIIKFTTAIHDSVKNEKVSDDVMEVDVEKPLTRISLKVLALKVLSLKVAAYIKWNPVLLRAVPFKIQINVLQDLLYFTSDFNALELPNVPILASLADPSGEREEYVFALVLYHRWLLSTFMNRINNENFNARTNGDMNAIEENVFCTPVNLDIALAFLTASLEWKSIPKMLTYECFVPLTETSRETQFKWEESKPISRNEFNCQVYYDLGTFYFFREEYESAATHFQKSRTYINNLVDPCGFCSFAKDALDSYLLACDKESQQVSLYEKLNACISNNYEGILNVLVEDNKTREIPLSHRLCVELDLIGGISCGKISVRNDLVVKIQALNAARCIVEKFTAHPFNYNASNVNFLIWATSAMWKHLNANDKNLISNYFVELVICIDSEELLNKLLKHDVINDIFAETNVESLRNNLTQIPLVPQLLKEFYWDLQSPSKNAKLELRFLEQQIIACYNIQELRDLLVKVTVKIPSRPIWKINPLWELPIPLQSVVAAIPRGFIQDFSYIMLAKSRELMLSKDWNTSNEFLRVLETEVIGNGCQPKLAKLISWEMLLVQISQYFDEWPALHLNKLELIQSSENCLKNSEMIPRTEVMEQCVLFLLNLGHWEFLVSFNKPWSFIEISCALAQACQDIVKYKGLKKVSKEIWEIIVPIFAQTSVLKRATGGGAIVHRDSPTSNNKMQLLSFLTRLRDATALAVVISLLSRLINLLKDDSSIALNVDYVSLWPSVISGISSYNSAAVTEALSDLVLQALKYYPTNVTWLHLMGDLCFSNRNDDNSLKYYLQALIVQTDYFNLPVRGDEHIFRRMIKCCTHLGCHTQAAVLCQFLDPPDYTLAFRSLVDFKSCNDSVEAYYHCFWDTTILEYLVHLHHKRGEHQRKKKAVNTIGMLELNSNNNEEIQREAINLRKRIFLQAMCCQYVR